MVCFARMSAALMLNFALIHHLPFKSIRPWLIGYPFVFMEIERHVRKINDHRYL